ncbi:hypothetical protein A2U01_0115890, partial [Trifolium medium]|nr:hypothetical protein [Trifolium medium]
MAGGKLQSWWRQSRSPRGSG